MTIRTLIKQSLRMKPLPVGGDAPPLSLTADEGTWIKLPDFKDHLNVVLLFFRRMDDDATDDFLRSYDKRLNAFEELDTVVFGVSTFRTDRLREFRAELGLEFYLLYDPLAMESRKFGCSGRIRPYSRPAVVVVGKDGRIAAAEHGLVDVERTLKVLADLEGREVPEEQSEEKGFTGVRDPGGVAWRVQHITSEQARKMLAEDDSFKLVDVRTKAEFDAHHPPEAVHMPVDELPHRYQELGQTTHLLFIGQAGGRSAQAAEFMASIGASEVYDVEDGVAAWTGEPVRSASA